jgi:protein ImuA
MSRQPILAPADIREKLRELRKCAGVFSFEQEAPVAGSIIQDNLPHGIGIRPGGVVEWLTAKPGAGAVTAALQVMIRSIFGRGFWAIVDSVRDCYVPALSGWGVDPFKTLLLRPASLGDACWAIEQCLRCPGVSATLARVDQRIPERVRRRWQLAAEEGGGVGVFFRPAGVQREPVWADLRLLLTPLVGSQGETRRVKIEVLYCRGGRGGSAWVWEIDHAAGTVHLVPELAHPAIEIRAARA